MTNIPASTSGRSQSKWTLIAIWLRPSMWSQYITRKLKMERLRPLIWPGDRQALVVERRPAEPGGGPIVSRDWQIGGRILANVYNRNYLEGALTKTEIWSPVTAYYDNLAAANSGDVCEYAVVRILQRAKRNLGNSPHYPICKTGMAVSG